MTRRRQNQSSSIFSSRSIIGILGIVVVGFILYTLFKSILWVLGLLTPFLFIGALVLNYKVVTGFVMGIINGFKTNPAISILKGLATFFAFPVVALYLFVKALISRKLINVSGQKNKGYTDYEVVDEKEEDDDFLELPELEKVPSTQSKSSSSQSTRSQSNSGNTSSNEYEDLF